MTRHPATEGNDLQPNRVDAQEEVTAPDGSGGRVGLGNIVEENNPRGIAADPDNSYTATGSGSITVDLNSADYYVIEYEYDGTGSSVQLSFPNAANDINYSSMDGTDLSDPDAGINLVSSDFSRGVFKLSIHPGETAITNEIAGYATTNLLRGSVISSSRLSTFKLQAFGVSPSGDWTVDVYEI